MHDPNRINANSREQVNRIVTLLSILRLQLSHSEISHFTFNRLRVWQMSREIIKEVFLPSDRITFIILVAATCVSELLRLYEDRRLKTVDAIHFICISRIIYSVVIRTTYLRSGSSARPFMANQGSINWHHFRLGSGRPPPTKIEFPSAYGTLVNNLALTFNSFICSTLSPIFRTFSTMLRCLSHEDRLVPEFVQLNTLINT